MGFAGVLYMLPQPTCTHMARTLVIPHYLPLCVKFSIEVDKSLEVDNLYIVLQNR